MRGNIFVTVRTAKNKKANRTAQKFLSHRFSENKGLVVVVDQHAAHERIRLEQIKAGES